MIFKYIVLPMPFDYIAQESLACGWFFPPSLPPQFPFTGLHYIPSIHLLYLDIHFLHEMVNISRARLHYAMSRLFK